MEANDAKEILIKYKTFDEFQDFVKDHMEIKIEKCSKHGDVNHSYCDLTGLNVCVECLKERRFYKKKE